MTGKVVKANGINIWYEGFGNPNNPTFLLIMGACTQGILWPTEFCEKLAKQGFYVIRYDHRDAGDSTCFNYDKTPYSQMDMMADAIGLLDTLKITKSHIFGLSSGGTIAQLMASHHPDRVLSLGLIATTCDMRPCNLALANEPAETGLLSSPKPHYLNAMEGFINDIPQTDEDALQQRVYLWGLLNGDKVPLELQSQRALHKKFLQRLKYREGIENHIKANYLSEEQIKQASKDIHVPTVVFQGSEDPIFPPDHGQELARRIKGSEYHLLEGHGHIPNPAFFDQIVSALTKNTTRSV